MRDGKKGWLEKGYSVVNQKAILDKLIQVNDKDLKSIIISDDAAKKLSNYTFVDFRSKDKYDTGHVEGANHVDYPNMFTKPMMEELNKSNSLVIIHDVPQVAGVIAATLKMMEYPSVYILQ